MEWKKKDPRFDINKRARIIIIKSYGNKELESSIAYVETKNVYAIFTDFDKPYHYLDVDFDWPKDWYWTFVPKELR